MAASSSSAIRMAAEGSPRVTKREPAQPEGFRWLRLSKLTYVDKKGKTRFWEVAERCHAAAPSADSSSKKKVDGVFICATIVRKTRPPELLLIRQFRPPMDCEVVEFVAGLIDAGETPEQAALRELKEETGYSEGVTVTKVTAGMPLDPGMSNSCAGVVFVEIDGDHPANLNPVACPEDGEYIVPFTVPFPDLETVLGKMESDGYAIDVAVWCYAFGWLAASRRRGEGSSGRGRFVASPGQICVAVAGLAAGAALVARASSFLSRRRS